MAARHLPVLLEAAVAYLQPQPDQHFIDCTLGGGGHARAILERTSPLGSLLAIDLDAQALAASREELKQYNDRVTFVHDNFAKLKQIYHEQFTVHQINGILLDLGLSSLELEDPHRGFSFQLDGPLDMRFDVRQPLTAADIVNTWPFEKIRKVIREYGEEPLAPEITTQIVSARQRGPITKTKTLLEAVLLAFRNKLHSKKEVPWIGGTHPATRTFQALRIAVNHELENVSTVLPAAIDILQPGGRLAVIAFHSLEDRIVKQYFKRESRDCICPPELPVCQCQHAATVRLLTKRPIKPTDREIERNPRSRSALLRVAEKLPTISKNKIQ